MDDFVIKCPDSKRWQSRTLILSMTVLDQGSADQGFVNRGGVCLHLWWSDDQQDNPPKTSANLFSPRSSRRLHPPQQTVRTASGRAACSDSSPIRTRTQPLRHYSSSAGCLAWPNNPLLLKTFYLPLQKLCKNDMYSKYNFVFWGMCLVWLNFWTFSGLSYPCRHQELL